MNGMLSRVASIAVMIALVGAGVPVVAQSPSQPPPPTGAESNDRGLELPDSPGTVNSGAQAQTAAPATQNAPQSTEQPAQAGNNQAGQNGQASGTAVAPAVQLSGGAASKPAGVAIAPPKQRRVRSWLIRFGFIAGAGAALGTVAALSAASPGRVPGSH